VPYNFAAADGTKLGEWVRTQRKAYKTGKLSPERVARLEAAAFVWDAAAYDARRLDAHADGWDARFELLTAYHVAHGDCAVSRSFAAADGTKLGLWVDRQRKSYKAGKLSPERVERLEAVGFAWRIGRGSAR
jgi:hypothetical protein